MAGPETETPSFRRRASARRRLRHLRRVREFALRDLGGLVLELDRAGRTREDLVRGKLDALKEIDLEVQSLEDLLGERAAVTELGEPGIVSCPRCGEIGSSSARFCSACGSPMDAPPEDETAPDEEQPTGEASAAAETAIETPATAPPDATP